PNRPEVPWVGSRCPIWTPAFFPQHLRGRRLPLRGKFDDERAEKKLQRQTCLNSVVIPVINACLPKKTHRLGLRNTGKNIDLRKFCQRRKKENPHTQKKGAAGTKLKKPVLTVLYDRPGQTNPKKTKRGKNPQTRRQLYRRNRRPLGKPVGQRLLLHEEPP